MVGVSRVRLWLGLTLFCGALAGLNLDDAAVTVVSTATGSCTRFYSHDGHVGCATPGQDGVDAEIFGITSLAHLDTFTSAGAASGTRALVMDIELLTKASMAQLVATKRVAGLLLLQTTTPPKAWSPGGAANSFNPAGFNALNKTFGFPISLVDQTQSATMLRYAEGNRAAAASTTLLPVYKAKLSWFMGPEAADVRVCLQWRTLTNTHDPKCIPVGGESVWSMITPPGAAEPARVVMATAQMDARSLFYSLAPGANTAASGAVALLGAARALKGKVTTGMDGIAFALFQGEAWNAIGSTTFVDDVLNFKCETPAKDRNGADICLKPAMGSLAFRNLKTTLKEVVAVDQVGKKDSSLYLHCATQPCASKAVVSGVTPATGTKGLPTTTATAFEAMGGVNRYVLGGYDTDFAGQNPYFSGHLDQVAAVSTAAITNASTKLAQTLWSLAGGPSGKLKEIAANATVIAELFECVTQNWACPLWQEFAKPLQKAMEQQASEPGWTNTFPPRPSPQINGKERKPPATSLDLYTGTVWGSSAFGSGQSLGTRLPYIFKYCSSRKNETSCTLGGTNGCLWDVNPTDATKNACVRSGTLNYMSKSSSWNSALDAVAVWPNLYELSAFGFFADTAGAALGTAQNGTYYHTAVSRALIQPQYESGGGSAQKGTQFDVNVSASKKNLNLLFAEPFWQPPSTTVYADAGDGVAYAALAVGLVIAAAGFFCAKRTSQFLTKEKLL